MTETRLLYSHSSKINSKAAKSAAHITVICSVNCRRNSATVIYWKTKCTAATDTHTLKHTKIHTQHPLVWWGFPTVCLSESWTNVPYISTPWARCSSLQTHCSCSIQSEICSNGISVCVIDFRFQLIHMGEKKTNTHTHTRPFPRMLLHRWISAVWKPLFTFQLWLFSLLSLLFLLQMIVQGHKIVYLRKTPITVKRTSESWMVDGTVDLGACAGLGKS